MSPQSHIFLLVPLLGLPSRPREVASEVEGFGESGAAASLGPSVGDGSRTGSPLPPGRATGATGQGMTGPVTGSEGMPGTWPDGTGAPGSGGPQGGLPYPEEEL